ncbi:MvdC/MvdD family ATP grasp protein [Streptosporangium carneum]|uniref:ATP-grasp ribosomal peptide maturase n=1 Tax=Streptosporangium carneum TaxID=47481 RepID=A0A9W6MBG3_9ACTN|nr:ATP-dependent carboxylate-amine ligase [Streptosporangium carneum]GLK07780.1 ATP-grasp ribosomal peptide maturase [Streptosporangium carneum]
MILVLSRKDDLAVNLVLPELAKRGVEALWWDPGDYPAESRIISRLVDGAWRHTLVTGGAEYDCSVFSAVWNRRPSRPRAADVVEDATHRGYVEKLARIYLNGWEDTFDTRWFPARSIDVIRTQNKLLNLTAAARLGFTVPETTVTNDPETLVEAWTEAEGRLIAKEVEFVEFGIDGAGHNFYTTPVSRRHLTSRHRLAHAPAILQPYVDKAVELRITVVGDRVFTAELHSQGSRATRHDYRHYEGNFSQYAVHDLPEDVERRCVDLVGSLGLAFGCIDVILTPEGEYVYLEVNPNGQWGWIEEFTDLPISEAIADWLVAGEVPA